MTRNRPERFVEFIAAALQVPSFLIVRQAGAGDAVLADPLYEELLRRLLDSGPPLLPTPGMEAFVFSLASALRADLVRDMPLARAGPTRFRFTSSRVSSLHIQIMTNWLRETRMADIAELAASWSRELGAAEGADRQDAVAWHVVQTAAGVSCRATHSRALLSQAAVASVEGLCGHR